jgi:putative OPT family oligopeptide transporter
MSTAPQIPAQEYPDIVGIKPDGPPPFEPYIAAETNLREFTPLPIIVGTLLGMVFGASSLYLVLKVGLTVSASIPVAVISITLFRILSKVGLRNATILENNIVQTAGSAGESIAFGVGVTMPAILILGFDLHITRVMLVAVLGGLLGILMMIPLRRALIVQQHGILKYPEGTACAEVLKAGASPESRAAASASARREQEALGGVATSAKTIFTGFGIGLLYKSAMAAFKGWKDVPEKVFGPPFNAASVSAEISPELLGVGYIIGPRIASVMAAGGVLSFLVLIPAIKFFGSLSPTPVPPGTIPIAEMSPGQIWGAYILYIGAGAVAAGGIISLGRSLPTIWHGLRAGLKDVQAGPAKSSAATPRTDRDLSMKFVLIGVIVLVTLIVLARPLQMNLLGALLIIAFGFLFVTVSSRLTGEIGSSSNPISGMTVATLLLTCLVFLVLGWTAPPYYVTALSVGAIVCIAASNGGTTSQDLKTGFLVGGTPKYQQIAILIGALASALILGPILLRLNDAGTVYLPRTTQQQAAAATTGAAAPATVENFPAALRVDPSTLTVRETIRGPQSGTDSREYLVWHKTDEVGGPAGKYLVDDSGAPVYFVDPGINGVHTTRPDGTTVAKFAAPKATLMSYIIKGILSRELPWGLVLLGVMIAVVLEMSGIPSLAFAVGVYLPLSSSSPIFIGGLVRWAVDRWIAKKHRGKNLTPEQLVAEGDKSPGVLMASGYIAGGAIAGIIIAFMAGVLGNFTQRVTDWSTANNGFFNGPNADLLSLIPFAILIILLYLTGREMILAHRKDTV